MISTVIHLPKNTTSDFSLCVGSPRGSHHTKGKTRSFATPTRRDARGSSGTLRRSRKRSSRGGAASHYWTYHPHPHKGLTERCKFTAARCPCVCSLAAPTCSCVPRELGGERWHRHAAPSLRPPRRRLPHGSAVNEVATDRSRSAPRRGPPTGGTAQTHRQTN